MLEPDGELPRGRAGDRCAAAYNDVLFLGLANKIKIKGEVIPKNITNREWNVHVPRGNGWQWTRGEDDGLWTVRKRYPDGYAIIRMRSYSWARLYTTPDGETGGDNMGGMMKQGQQSVLEHLSDVKKRKKKIGGKLNKYVKKTLGYSMEGMDEDEDVVHVRAWYFKGKERMFTYSLQVWRYGTVPNDGQIDYILGTIKEKPKKE